jgi:hypothetical protein
MPAVSDSIYLSLITLSDRSDAFGIFSHLFTIQFLVKHLNSGGIGQKGRVDIRSSAAGRGRVDVTAGVHSHL